MGPSSTGGAHYFKDMMLLDGTNFRGSDADEYVPGQNAQGSYQNNPLTDEDSYQSNNPRQAPTNDDSGYNFANEKYGQKDPEFQSSYQQAQKGGLAKQAGNAIGKAKSALDNIKGVAADTPENRERIKQEAKDRIKKYAKDKIKDKFGQEVKDVSKDAIKKAAKETAQKAVKKVGKKVGEELGKQGAKLAVRGAAEVGGKVAAGAGSAAVSGTAATVVGGAAVASAPETLGIGLLIGLLLEIAMYLGLSDAVDCTFELGSAANALRKGDVKGAAEHHKKARFHAEKASMLLLMGFLLIIAVGMTFSILGWIIGIPMLILMSFYMFAGVVFPTQGYLQGLSKKPMQIFLLLFDLLAIIIFLAFVASIFWYICETSGLGTGFFSNLATKAIDWWSGNEFASTFNEVCTDISKF